MGGSGHNSFFSISIILKNDRRLTLMNQGNIMRLAVAAVQFGLQGSGGKSS